MKAVITGATGFIGRALCRAFYKDYEITALTRNVERAGEILDVTAEPVQWDGRTLGDWIEKIDGADIIINLAGDNIASGKWDRQKKNLIFQSRVNSIKALSAAIGKAEIKPRVFIQASAIGYYGTQGDKKLVESSPPGRGFLPEVCRVVENATLDIERQVSRCITIRTGVVLGADGGALPKLAKPFKFYLGGHLGSGKQWFSWISLEDYIAAIKFFINNENMRGTFNLTSPEPITMKQLCKALGGVLHRPSWLPVPAFALRMMFGEMADEMLLCSQRVLPEQLQNCGFKFKYPEIQKALKAIFNQKD